MWVNEGRGLWNLTEEGASKAISRNKIGKLYKSKSDGLWWSKDTFGHGGCPSKVFTENKKGLQWYRDADQFGDFITGKHKGPTGLTIPWKQTSRN
jgi:hypothetical protein